MNVWFCKSQECPYCKRYTYSSSYKPRNYHRIGISHAFHACLKNQKRCVRVLKDECVMFDIPEVKENKKQEH